MNIIYYALTYVSVLRTYVRHRSSQPNPYLRVHTYVPGTRRSTFILVEQ